MDQDSQFIDEVGEVDEVLFNALLKRIRPPGVKIEIIATPNPSEWVPIERKDVE